MPPPAPGIPACSHRPRTGHGSADRRSGCRRRSRATSAGSDHPAAPSVCACPTPVSGRHGDVPAGPPRGRCAAASCVGREALPRQQVAQAAIAEPATLRHKFAQPLPQCAVIRPCRLETDHPAAHSNQSTRPTLAHPVMLPGMSEDFPLGARRYHFFEARSFSTALSSIGSANSFFSREFSSSSDRNRRASDIFRPPNFDFHL